MTIPSKVYDILKWVVMVCLPAVNVLVASLGAVIGYSAEVPCGVISAVTVFLGALIGVSTYNYNKSDSEDAE